ncbi:RHS repeat-associated core domain-containing protein [Flavobacterium sp. UW10123]|uniref:RHS repeat-associated core domain-containing protein n=1 Tax=Flavobacterium sp. UW10123 TaxID=3230800 RepID=UPI003393D507
MKKFYISLLFLLIGLFGFGQSTEVGITEGELSVSLTGAATYKIPIAVPPGIKGVVPQISLVYNSQGNNGVPGYGWNIAGISKISRIPSTRYHDGVIDPVDFNALDRFSLDGQRLIVKNGTSGVYGASGTVYETESFSNIKVTSYGVDPLGAKYGPMYFIVEYPDGSKASYGNSADSRSAMDWAINYWENPQGVRISYYYSLLYSVLDIVSIKYGSLTTGTPINEIQFVYNDRQRLEQAYVGGLSIINKRLLKEIKVIGNNVGFRNYSLTHDTSSLGYERLITIQEKSGDGTKSYSPTIFKYGGDIVKSGITSLPPVYIQDPINYGSIYTPKTTVGDFDGDGDLDFMDDFNVLYTGIYDNGSTPKKVNIPAIDIWGDHKKRFVVKCVEKIENEFKVMDRDAWCNQYFKKNNNIYTGKFEIFSLDLSSNQVKTEYIKQIDIPNNPWLENLTSFNGDFNGDNLTDIIVIKNDYTGVNYDGSNLHRAQLFFVNLDRRKESNYVRDLGFIENVHQDEKFIQTGDVNGDGKTDLIFFRGGVENSIVVYTLDENEMLVKLWETKYPFIHSTYQGKDVIFYENILPGFSYPILSGDFNGDGKTDFILPGLEREILFSTGNSFIREALPTTFVPSREIRTILAIDFDNDGKTDVLNLTSNQTRDLQPLSEVTLTTNYLTRNTSGVWISSKQTFSNLNAYFYTSINPIMIKTSKLFSDKPELLIYEPETILGYTNGVATQSYLEKFKVGFYVNNDALTNAVRSIKSITTGNGVKETITYSSLINDKNVYSSSDYLENFPNVDIKSFPSFKVVSQIEKQSKDVYKKKMFSYYGAVTNVEGLGLLGFRSKVQTNWHDNTSPVISYISKNDMSLRGANIENYTVLGLHQPLRESSNRIASSIIKENDYTVTGNENLVASQSIILKPNTWIKPGSTFSAKINTEGTNTSINEPSTFITKSVLAYESELFSNKVFKLKNISNKQFNGLENTSSETKTDYDEYNNAIKVRTEIKEGATTQQTNIIDIAYQNQTSPYIIGRPLSKSQEVTLGSEKIRTEEIYGYDARQLLSKIKKKGDASTNYITEDRAYDSFGNIIKRTFRGGQDSREFNYEYDLSGRFLSKEIDAEKLVTNYLYNSNGTLKSITNPLGQTTLFEYDSWFKKINETNCLGNKDEYKYVNSNGNTILTKTYADGNVAEETFDDLGRKIKSGSKNIMGSFTYISYAYDIQDRNYKVSEPYIGTAPSQWNETKYDDYGRVTSQNLYTGKIINIDNKTPLTIKVNDGTISKTYKKDAVGNVVSMFDSPSNEIRYTYFANGNLKEVNYDGIKTKFLQDGWGRRVQMEDPSAGVFKYGYNDFGDLINEENKNGITSYKLTSAGRLDEKTISGIYNSTAKYMYDGTNKLLLSTQFNDGVNTIKSDYAYDDKKRIGTKIESTPFAVFTKDYRYDSYGRLLTEASIASRLGGKASSKTVKYGYKNGMLYQIFDNGTNALLWQTNTINAKGQLLTAQNGPLTQTNEYDSYGYNKQFKFDKTTPSVNILSLGTSFNATTGNLDNRTNNLMAWNESFKYDNFDRLTEFIGISGAKETQAYDDKGRITQNSLGTYTYSNDKPYQNASITVSSEALEYYKAKPSQIIDYNVFKSPVLINEKDVDKVSFDYNDNNYRTAMFYGDLQDDKLKRPFRKYYSADGTMEIKENRTTGVTDFVTYIGGDGYTAPIVFKSNGDTDQKYLFLQRDYQNSIVAITDPSGTVLEKRIFDAWGTIAKVQDGAGNTLSGLTILDRGYTGHEHLQSVGLINMNARLYDSKLHRFLQPDNNIQDPFNTQNYNRYGYVMNNPLRYTDASGESWNVVFGYLFAAYVKGAYESGGQLNPGKWTSNAWTSAFAGAASGAASSYTTGVANNYLDNYNNKPALGASAIGEGYDLPSYIENKSKGDFDFKAANNIEDTRPLIQQYSEHPRVSYQEYDPMGGILTTIATGFALVDYKMFNKDTWYSIKKMKTYSQSFNGNGYTGGKIASASRISTGFKIAGYGLGTYNAWSINKQYNNGELSTSSMVIEQSSNLYSTLGGTYGVAWGIGWEGGRTITKTIWYQDWKNNYWYPFREEHLGY